VPVYNGLTDEWHPTQMLADFLTMGEASGKPYDTIAYTFAGDCRFNMGRSLLVMGALMGSDVRLTGPGELHPPKDVIDLATGIAGRTGARITITNDPAEAVADADAEPTCGCRWASPRTSGRSASSSSGRTRSTPRS
jgi:ornithine carbamoyltransferase